jgi:hypothetical protein
MSRMPNYMSKELRRLIASRAECYPPFLSALSEATRESLPGAGSSLSDGETCMARDRRSSKKPSDPSPDSLEARYPNIAAWVQDGWIEIGRDDYSRSFVRALDIGGMVWEGEAEYSTLYAALRALDAGIAAWLDENG